MMILKYLLILCIIIPYTFGSNNKKGSDDEQNSKGKLKSNFDLSKGIAHSESSKKIVKRFASNKNEVLRQPGVDYPTLTSIPNTSFSCRGQKGGYYADLDTNCQVFHICDNGKKISFLCPNGTIFQQSQLICDWWFKVDCSKSVDFYEQSAEFLAEEEKKRLENKKINSEFHRSNKYDSHNKYQSTNYDGRQNGRVNPYSQFVTNNNMNSTFNTMITYSERNQLLRNQMENTKNQLIQDNVKTVDKNVFLPPNDKTQNLLFSNKIKESKLHDEKDSNIYHNFHSESNLKDEYFGSAANVNAQREIEQHVKPLTTFRTFTRQNLKSSFHKMIPGYTETTMFRTSTERPLKELQHLAESKTLALSRGNNYKSSSSNRFNNFNWNSDTRKSSVANSSQLPSSSSFIGAVKDQKITRNPIRPRINVPTSSETTFIPIYKLKTNVLSSDKVSTNNYRSSKNINHEQRYQEQSANSIKYRTSLVHPQYVKMNPRDSHTISFYNEESTNTVEPTLTKDKYTTILPTGRETYTTEFLRDITPSIPSITNYDSEELTNFQDIYSKIPVTTQTITLNKISSLDTLPVNIDRNINISTSTEPCNNFELNDTTHKPEKYETQTFTKTNNQDYLENMKTSTKTTVFTDISQNGTTNIPSPVVKTNIVNYTSNEKNMFSTFNPYVPFTKNYVFTAKSTIADTFSIPTDVEYQVSETYSSNLKSHRNFIPSSSQKVNQLKYIPQRSTQISYTNKNILFDSKSLSEKEHVMNILKSFDDLKENTFKSKNHNNNLINANIPTSTGPSTLHSLALYVANTADSYSTKEPMDVAINIDYSQNIPIPIEQKNISSWVKLPNILTKHTISSYAELFKLNDALENSILNDNDGNSDEDSIDGNSTDLDVEQSEGPLNGMKKVNDTKLRELAQVFTQALSAYLQDPNTFKKVLSDIRPTEPHYNVENKVTTTIIFTTEDYPFITKEEDEVLDFSDDINSLRKKRPTTTPTPKTIIKSTDNFIETTYQPYYTFEYLSAITLIPKKILNDTDEDVDHSEKKDGFSHQAYDMLDSKKFSGLKNYSFNKEEIKNSSAVNEYDENYILNKLNKYGGFQNNSADIYSAYGEYVDVLNLTSTNENNIKSSAMPVDGNIATYKVPVSKINNILKNQLNENSSPLRVRYYDIPTQKKKQIESFISTDGIHSRNNENFDKHEEPYLKNKSTLNNKYTNEMNSQHWTFSPKITKLWETTVFIDPNHINRGLETDSRNNKFDIHHRTIIPLKKNNLQTSNKRSTVNYQNTINNHFTPWQLTLNNHNLSTKFTLSSNQYPNTESTNTEFLDNFTTSKITLTSESTTKKKVMIFPNNYKMSNMTITEIQNAHKIFGKLNETSTNKLISIMEQAENNSSIRQLVLLLINHCNGSANKTLDERSEQLLNALLKMPINAFSTGKAKEQYSSLNEYNLSLEKLNSETENPVVTTINIPSMTINPTLIEPLMTTYSSKSNTELNMINGPSSSSTWTKNKFFKKLDENSSLNSRQSVQLAKNIVSSNDRALNLLKSLYTIAAKWS